MEAALAKLSYRMRTESELRKALEELEFDSGDIDSTIDELKTLGYIDDERYVREFYRSSRRKNWSKNRMIRALADKGITAGRAKAVIDDFEASDEFEDLGLTSDERSQALELGRNMFEKQIMSGKPCDEKFFGRVGRRLMTLGYDSGCCYYVIRKLKDMGHTHVQEEEG